jgi:hypothetical protein
MADLDIDLLLKIHDAQKCATQARLLVYDIMVLARDLETEAEIVNCAGEACNSLMKMLTYLKTQKDKLTKGLVK